MKLIIKITFIFKLHQYLLLQHQKRLNNKAIDNLTTYNTIHIDSFSTFYFDMICSYMINTKDTT